ncbi:MAG: hypothetical protein AAF621_06065 [Pseudomonadota bacterium]
MNLITPEVIKKSGLDDIWNIQHSNLKYSIATKKVPPSFQEDHLIDHFYEFDQIFNQTAQNKTVRYGDVSVGYDPQLRKLKIILYHKREKRGFEIPVPEQITRCSPEEQIHIKPASETLKIINNCNCGYVLSIPNPKRKKSFSTPLYNTGTFMALSSHPAEKYLKKRVNDNYFLPLQSARYMLPMQMLFASIINNFSPRDSTKIISRILYKNSSFERRHYRRSPEMVFMLNKMLAAKDLPMLSKKHPYIRYMHDLLYHCSAQSYDQFESQLKTDIKNACANRAAYPRAKEWNGLCDHANPEDDEKRKNENIEKILREKLAKIIGEKDKTPFAIKTQSQEKSDLPAHLILKDSPGYEFFAPKAEDQWDEFYSKR